MQSTRAAIAAFTNAAAIAARLTLLLTVLVLQAGCANFKAVSAFADQTSNLTSTVKTEFSQLDRLCVDLAELDIVVNAIEDDGPLRDCARHRASQGRLALLTVGVLDNYARALGALADNRSFNLSPEIQNIGGRLQNLRDRNGRPLADAKQIGALTQIVDLLADLVTSAQREAAVRRMVQQTPNLKITGELLRSFFVSGQRSEGAAAKAPYVNLMAIAASAVKSSETALSNPAFRAREPIRTSEVMRQLLAHKQLVALRIGEAPDRVPQQVVAAIDAWQAAVDQFATDALKPDPQALYERLTTLRDKTLAAREAVEGLRD